MEDASGAEAILGGAVPVSDLPQQVLLRHPDLVVAHLAVVRPRAAPDPDPPFDDDARVRCRHDDLDHPPRPFVVLGLLGPTHDDEEVGRQAVGGEPLVPVDDPLVALEDRSRLNGTRVRASVLRFGHGEPRLHRSLDEGEEPLLLLLLRPVLDQDRLVARVGRHHSEQRRRAHRVGEDLVHVGVGHEVDAHAAVLGGEVGRPEALGLHLLLNLLPELLGLAALGIRDVAGARVPEQRLVGQDLLVDDARRAKPDVVDVVAQPGNGCHVDGHGSIPRVVFGPGRNLTQIRAPAPHGQPSGRSGPARSAPGRRS